MIISLLFIVFYTLFFLSYLIQVKEGNKYVNVFFVLFFPMVCEFDFFTINFDFANSVPSTSIMPLPVALYSVIDSVALGESIFSQSNVIVFYSFVQLMIFYFLYSILKLNNVKKVKILLLILSVLSVFIIVCLLVQNLSCSLYPLTSAIGMAVMLVLLYMEGFRYKNKLLLALVFVLFPSISINVFCQPISSLRIILMPNLLAFVSWIGFFIENVYEDGMVVRLQEVLEQNKLLSVRSMVLGAVYFVSLFIMTSSFSCKILFNNRTK